MKEKLKKIIDFVVYFMGIATGAVLIMHGSATLIHIVSLIANIDACNSLDKIQKKKSANFVPLLIGYTSLLIMALIKSLEIFSIIVVPKSVVLAIGAIEMAAFLTGKAINDAVIESSKDWKSENENQKESINELEQQISRLQKSLDLAIKRIETDRRIIDNLVAQKTPGREDAKIATTTKTPRGQGR